MAQCERSVRLIEEKLGQVTRISRTKGEAVQSTQKRAAPLKLKTVTNFLVVFRVAAGLFPFSRICFILGLYCGCAGSREWRETLQQFLGSSSH